MSITIAQVPATWNIDANLITVREVLGETHPGDVVVLPEGMLSGYGEDLTPLDTIDSATVNHAVAQTAQLAAQKQVHIFCGSLLPLDGGWCNAGLFFPAASQNNGSTWLRRRLDCSSTSPTPPTPAKPRASGEAT